MYPDVARPYKVPVSDRGFALMGALCFAWVLLGSWVAVFPGTLEALFGIDYPFEDYWGVSQVEFEVFTLGTLGVLLVLGVSVTSGAPAYVAMWRRRPARPLPRPAGGRLVVSHHPLDRLSAEEIAQTGRCSTSPAWSGPALASPW